MTLDLENVMRVNITRTHLPDYTLPLLCGWLSENRHHIPYKGDVAAYLTELSQQFDLPLPELGELDVLWVEKLRESASLEVLMAFLAKVTDHDLFEAFIKLNLLKHRRLFSAQANAIDTVICADFNDMLTAFACAVSGLKVTFYTQRGMSLSGINEVPYWSEIAWVFKLVLPQVRLIESCYDIDQDADNIQSLIRSVDYDYATTAIIGDDQHLIVKDLFSYFLYNVHDEAGVLSVRNMSVDERVRILMTDKKMTYVKSAIAYAESSQVMLLDFAHPSTQVTMMSLIGYESLAGNMGSFEALLADTEYTTLVNTTEIIANKYNFLPRYYAKDNRAKTWLKAIAKFNCVDLSELVTFHRAPVLKAVDDLALAKPYTEILLSDINEFSRIKPAHKIVYVNAQDAIRLDNEGLEKGDIIFAIKGDIGKVALIDNVSNTIIGKTFITLRIKQKYRDQGISPEYLVAYLADDHVKHFISHLNTGAKVENIRMDDLKSIPVIVEQNFVAEVQFAINAMEKQRRTIAKEFRVYRQIRDALSQSIAGNGLYLHTIAE